MLKACFVSDLHLLANRSRGEIVLDRIRRAVSGRAALVLGGDIFDFRWAVSPTTEAAVQTAASILGRLVSQCPQCHVHYVLGNHDYHRLFLPRLDALAVRAPNLSWHRFHLRLGASAFLHGDVADLPAGAEDLARARGKWLDEPLCSGFRSRMYDVVVAGSVHKLICPLVYPKRKVVRRILAYLNHVGLGPEHGIRNVYFGHTHRPLSGFGYGGVTFHNAGAAIKAVELRILEADIS